MAEVNNTPTFGERKYGDKKTISFNRLPVENVLQSNDGKAQIVLGSDRPSHASSGYGGLGVLDSSAIDLVCGRGKTISEEDKEGAVTVNPDFFSDAARIYISEKTDVDNNFKLVKGSGNSTASSAIALKADAIRMIGVEGIKLITRANPTNSNGTEAGVKGIDLIAGNDDSFLQPMVKGDNLVDCLNELSEIVSSVQAQVHSVMNFLDTFIDAYKSHVHPPPGTAAPPDAVIVAALFAVENSKHTTEDNVLSNRISDLRNTYLKIPSHESNILSQYNKTN